MIVNKLLALLLLVVSGSVWANIGSVTEHTGTAIIKRGKNIVPINKGTVVELLDRVETKNGRVKITFTDNTTVSVTESSALDIDEFVYDPKSSTKGKLGLKAAAGTVRYVSGAIASNNPNSVNIKTPTATIAVRGTDFVMSVNEIGSSMIILMPTCDWETSAVKGLVCNSGKIDVESGGTIVNMNRPYQATLVEKTGAAPTPPITINLFSSAINNNLQIAPPRTMNGLNVVRAARAAVAETNSSRNTARVQSNQQSQQTAQSSDSSQPIDNTPGSEADTVASESNKEENTGKKEEKTENTAQLSSAVQVIDTKTEVKTEVVITEETTEDPNLRKIYAGAVQIGWGYESISKNSKNYTNVVLPVNTQIQLIITQDRMMSGYNFSNGRAIGQIVINQNYR